MYGQWVCLSINTSFHHGDKEAVALEMERVFAGDVIETRVVSDDVLEGSGEYFALVKCSDYFSHVDSLKESVAVLRVVPSYAEPAFLSEAEVDSFSKSVSEEEKPQLVELFYGDIVRVRKDVSSNLQHLSGLYGIVVGFGKRENWYRVFFRFETKSFERVICSTSLTYTGNVLENLIVRPFTQRVKRKNLFKKYRVKARKAMQNLVNRDKIRRRQRRKHEKPYRRR